MIRMKNYLWKNLIVFICVISTLLLQGFSCYAAASGADISRASRDNISSFYSSDISSRNMLFALEYMDVVDAENAITDTDNADIDKENVISETESAETETEDAITEAESAETEDVSAETECADTEDITVETENDVAEADNTGMEGSSSSEDSAEMKNTVSSVVTDEEVVVVEQPVISEYGVQPFDYIIDPQCLITATNGIKYGNISFEEGSTLYFRNMEGNYDYSSRSDQLTITSQSTVPVKITLTASLQNLDHIFLTSDPDFKGDSRNSLYFALVDDKGNMVPLSESGEVKIVYEMGEISEDEAIEGTGEEQYSFGLMGACNPNGSWEYLTELPQVVVSWGIEPIINNEETVLEDCVSDNSISMNSVSDNSISMNSVSDNSISVNSVSDNSISENGGVLSSGVQNVENYVEETGADIQESVDEVSGNVIAENNVTDNNVETEDSGNADVAETEFTLTEDSVLTDLDTTDTTDATTDTTDATTETETVQTEDSSNVDAAETAAAAGGSGNASGDGAGVTGSNMSSQATTETVSVLSDSSASVQTGLANIEVESGTYY